MSDEEISELSKEQLDQSVEISNKLAQYFVKLANEYNMEDARIVLDSVSRFYACILLPMFPEDKEDMNAFVSSTMDVLKFYIELLEKIQKEDPLFEE
jgi:hypothetical protein